MALLCGILSCFVAVYDFQTVEQIAGRQTAAINWSPALPARLSYSRCWPPNPDRQSGHYRAWPSRSMHNVPAARTQVVTHYGVREPGTAEPATPI